MHPMHKSQGLFLGSISYWYMDSLAHSIEPPEPLCSENATATMTAGLDVFASSSRVGQLV